MTTEPDILRREIAERVQAYYESAFPSRAFVPGETPVPVSGKVFDARELQHLVDSALDFWLTSGRFADSFEKRFAAFIGVKHALLVNSGSSANLLAISALTSPHARQAPIESRGTRSSPWPPGFRPRSTRSSRTIWSRFSSTSRCRPTTSMPDAMEAALSEKTRAVILAHTLGNPFDVDACRPFLRRARAVADRGLLRRLGVPLCTAA